VMRTVTGSARHDGELGNASEIDDFNFMALSDKYMANLLQVKISPRAVRSLSACNGSRTTDDF
jgi:hypothetical protein